MLSSCCQTNRLCYRGDGMSEVMTDGDAVRGYMTTEMQSEIVHPVGSTPVVVILWTYNSTRINKAINDGLFYDMDDFVNIAVIELLGRCGYGL